MKRMVCILQLLILLSTAALGEGVPGSFQEGQVHYQLSEGVPAVESVTPFIAQPYRFSDSEAIALCILLFYSRHCRAGNLLR